MAYDGIDVVVEAEIGNAIIVGVEGPFRIFAEDRAEGVDKWFPDVGPVPARSSRGSTLRWIGYAGRQYNMVTGWSSSVRR
jgi:hypothetical protein